MRRSEKILLAILILGLVTWQGWRLVSRLMVDPIRRSRAELDQLDEQIAAQQRQTAALERMENELARWKARSLPPDPLTAQRLYQQWLTDLAQDCGFAALKVFPDRVTRKNDACVGVLVSIDAEARLDQLCLFLSRFYRTDLAQQITVLNIDSTQDRGDPVLRVTIMAEGLSLRDAIPRQRLFPSGTLAATLDERTTTMQVLDAPALPPRATFLLRIGGEYLVGARLTETTWTVQRGADHSAPAPHPPGERIEFIPLMTPAGDSPAADYTPLVAQNPFAKPTPKVVERPPPPQAEALKIDPAEFTYLVAAFSQNDQRQAWLYDRLNNKNVVIGPGKPFSVAGIQGFVQAIGDDFVLLDYGESRWRLRLGKNLRSMERVSDATGAADERR